VSYQYCGERKNYTNILPKAGVSPIILGSGNKNIVNTFQLFCLNSQFGHMAGGGRMSSCSKKSLVV